MNARLGFRAGGVTAALACALLVACGGGGGSSGGGGVTPQNSPTPTPTATPTTAPTSQATSAPLSTSTSSPITFGGVSNGGTNVVSSATLTFPQVNAAANLNVTLTATAPSGVSAPTARTIHSQRPDAFGVQNVLAYFAVSVTAPVTIATTPSFSVTFPAAPSGNCYVLVFNPNQAQNGWQELLPSPSVPPVACGITTTFNAATLNPPFSFAANTVYVFAIVTTGNMVIPTPTPVPTATPTPTPNSSPTATPTATPTAGPPGASSPLPNVPSKNGFSPYKVATQFQFPVMSGYNGSGQTVVVVGDYPPLQSDLTAFQQFFQLSVAGSGTYTPVNVGTPGTPTDTSDQAEATLDVETIMALSPGANIEFYLMSDLSNQSFVAAYTQALSDSANPHVVSISYGGCENSYVNSTQDGVLKQGAANGIAFVASSGDQGDECYIGGTPAYIPGVNNPAADPYAIGVGGNENWDGSGGAGTGTLNSQVAWNDTDFFGPSSLTGTTQGATGGGQSTFFTPPPYQVGLSGAGSKRSVPDVAMPSEYVPVYLNGKFSSFGGTSWSAPEISAMLAGLDQYCGGSLGANPGTWFYTAFKRNPADFLDITSGTNQFKSDTTNVYNAAVGYDMTTGLGIPYGMQVAQTICANHVPAAGFKPAARGIVATDSYGEARDTMMAAAPHNYVQDLGARSSSNSSQITLVMRATPTIALDESKVIASLRTAGFTIVKTYPSHLSIVANAPASAINSYFRTQMHDVSQGSKGMRYTNVAPATIPAEIAPYVHGVLLDNLDAYAHM